VLAGDPRPAQEGAVAAEGDEEVELGVGELGRGRVLDQLTELRLQDQLDAESPGFRQQLRQEIGQRCVAPIPDEADLHEETAASSACRARTRAAIPSGESPASASCCGRGACSHVLSGAPSAMTRASGATVCVTSAT